MDIEDLHKSTRVAVVNRDACSPKKCGLECRKYCPVNSQGKLCVSVTKISTVSDIAESLCIGCGQCVRVCPFDAIQIVNLPKELSQAKCVFTYGKNSFRIFNMPLLKRGRVMGLIGANGTGKSTMLGLLTGSLTVNLGN